MTERSGGAIVKRYVHGAGADEPILWYEGSGTGNRRWLDADERGSIVRVTNDAGTALAVNSYDEFGIPGPGNLGRLQYTGQMWMPELGFYHYKARMYSPTLGRFMQTDPIGYGDGLNLYNYVGSDPVNNTDPSGTECKSSGDTIEVCGSRREACAKPGGVWVEKWKACFVSRSTLGLQGTGHVTIPIYSYGGAYFTSSAPVRPTPPSSTNEPQKEEPKPAPKPKYDARVNFCGGTGGPRVPNQAGGASINQACFAHDMCYSSSGIPKATCDVRFRRDIIRQGSDGKNSAALCTTVSWVYFGFVEDLGFVFYEK